MTRSVFLVCQLLILCAVTLTVTTDSTAQQQRSRRSGVITATSKPVYVGSDATSSQRSRDRNRERRPDVSASELERDVFALINRERRRKGLEALEWNDRIARVAREHSRSMASNSFFSHRGKDGSMVGARADKMGVRWRGIGENLVYFRNYEEPAEFAVKSWMNSNGHRKNILSNNWQESGIGVAINPDGTYYLTQVFVLVNEGQNNSRRYNDRAAQNENRAPAQNTQPKGSKTAILVDTIYANR